MKVFCCQSKGAPTVANIQSRLKDSGDDEGGRHTSVTILQNHFDALEQQIQTSRKQQQAIAALLQAPKLIEERVMTTERWVAIVKRPGLTRWV